jgi:hypothetical protein
MAGLALAFSKTVTELFRICLTRFDPHHRLRVIFFTWYAIAKYRHNRWFFDSRFRFDAGFEWNNLWQAFAMVIYLNSHPCVRFAPNAWMNIVRLNRNLLNSWNPDPLHPGPRQELSNAMTLLSDMLWVSYQVRDGFSFSAARTSCRLAQTDIQHKSWWKGKSSVLMKGLLIDFLSKIGILGRLVILLNTNSDWDLGNRTGSGKSTLALSFLRFVTPSEGKIIIDGLNISQVGLADLRSKVTIIPRTWL